MVGVFLAATLGGGSTIVYTTTTESTFSSSITLSSTQSNNSTTTTSSANLPVCSSPPCVQGVLWLGPLCTPETNPPGCVIQTWQNATGYLSSLSINFASQAAGNESFTTRVIANISSFLTPDGGYFNDFIQGVFVAVIPAGMYTVSFATSSSYCLNNCNRDATTTVNVSSTSVTNLQLGYDSGFA